MRGALHRSTVGGLVSLFVISGLVSAAEAPTATGDVEATEEDLRQDAAAYAAEFASRSMKRADASTSSQYSAT